MTANVGRRDAAIIVSGYPFGKNGSLPRMFLAVDDELGPSVAVLGSPCWFGLGDRDSSAARPLGVPDAPQEKALGVNLARRDRRHRESMTVRGGDNRVAAGLIRIAHKADGDYCCLPSILIVRCRR